MIVHRAAWVLPIACAPIRDGWVAVERGVVLGAGRRGDSLPASADPPDDSLPAPDRVILPGLVNAHTHLELSWMAGQIPPAASMPAWAERLIALRGSRGEDPPEAIRSAIAQCRACGTSLVGDITNTLAAYEPLLDSDLSAAVFLELLGFRNAEPAAALGAARARLEALTPVAWLRPALVPHAPYSVSPQLLRALAAEGPGPISVHLAESAAEIDFLREGTGPWRDLLVALGAWNADWQPPACRPLEYIARHGLVDRRLLAVHGVHLQEDELDRLAEAGATVVACPRSNRWTGAGDPPIERFYASGVRVAVGTDSLASAPDLNVFAELAAIRALAPDVPARRLLETATRAGADALGFGSELGTIEPGRRAELIAVDLPAGTPDVEEYLVSGVDPRSIAWLDPA